MNPTFTKAIRYFVEIECRSPLRTGSSERDPKAILLDSERVPFVQGTSLAGAFRAWMADPELFPETDRRSPLVFSDLRLENAEPVLRPRLRIDPATGTAMHSQKFDTAALPAGTGGSFQLIWTGHADPQTMAQRIERYLAALNFGEITLGAQKTNGFGRVAVRAKRRIYDMSFSSDLDAWLLGEDVTDAQAIPLSTRMEQDVLFTVTAEAPALLIKAPGSKRETINGRDNCSVFTPMAESGSYIVPGSSLKGSIRSQMARICPAVGYRPTDLENLFGRANRKSDGGAAGVIRFSDGQLADGKTNRVPRIRINRLTGGIMPQNIFFSDALGAAVTFEIRIPASHRAGCALVLYALRDLGLGLYELGSGSAVGRGRMQNLQVEILAPDGRASLRCTNGAVTLTDEDGLVARCTAELGKKVPL